MAQEGTDKRQISQKTSTWLLIILIAISSGLGGGWLGARVYNEGGGTVNTEQAKQTVLQESELINSIYRQLGPSVVSISVTSTARNFFDQQVSQQSAGTGFFISDDGYIVTNRHVLPQSSGDIVITMQDGTELDDVKVVGKTSEDDTLDVAVLKVGDTKGKKIKPAPLGDSEKTQVGDMVVAIGNALGVFENTVTSGILSGYGRSVQAENGTAQGENLQNLFQTDAAINPGNSGGPLVNANGEVIGINTAVAGDAENIGFAIPINDAKGIIEGIQEDGRFARPFLGVRYVDLTPAIAEELEIDQQSGAYIPENEAGNPSIVNDSPADQAGLQPEDIIIAVEDQKVDQTNTLSSVVGRFQAGEEVTIRYIRDGQQRTVEVTLQAVN